jgi:hypothetical protein
VTKRADSLRCHPSSSRQWAKLYETAEGFVNAYIEEVSKPSSFVGQTRSSSIHPDEFWHRANGPEHLLQDEMPKRVGDLEDELEATREDLGRYNCPFCDAELSSAGGYPIDDLG